MSTPTAKHTAAGSYLGFGLQTVRMCFHLLTAPSDAIVYVEHDDDVSVHYADGTKLFEQTKSAPKQNPISNWAVDLWKCFDNWLTDQAPVTSKDKDKSFRLYVTPPHPGAFVTAFSEAKSAAEISAAVANVQKEVNAAKKKTKAYGHAKRFLEGTADEQQGLALNFKLITEADPLEPIRALYRNAVSEELLNTILSFALGEAKRLSDPLIAAGLPAGLPAGRFQESVRHLVQKMNLPAMYSFTEAPGSTEVTAAHSLRPTFIRQLELIDVNTSQQLQAVSDYLRTVADKAKWADEGSLLPATLSQWEDSLMRRHAAFASKTSAVHSHLSKEQQGAAVYADCRGLDVQLENKSVPDHFTHGCFNDLSERELLGWHPDYKTLLAK